MKINVGKVSVMRYGTSEGQEPLGVSVNGEEYATVKQFKYLISLIPQVTN